MKTFADADYAPSQLRQWRSAARAGKGMLIVSGVTGSGKTTSQKIFIETLPGLERKAIYTVEDPIEYEIAGAHQIEVLRDPGDEDETRRRYSRVMKGLLRSDPDGVMLGEVRDPLTASFLLQVAETGHLAMGTLHAHLLPNIVPRLCNDQIGLSRQALTSPSIINLLVYQALVPLVCQHCGDTPRAAAQADPEVAEMLDLLHGKFKVRTGCMRFRHAGGCAHCKGRGTRGKRIVAEMWQPDRRWLRLVREGDDYGALMHYRSLSDRDFGSVNMTGKTVFEHTLWRAINGQVDPRECEEFETFDRFEILSPRSGAGGGSHPHLHVVSEA
jgi:type II secretory ATPase GspE/PulE/Tfp pilus assembly ATPase PilB-like protein